VVAAQVAAVVDTAVAVAATKHCYPFRFIPENKRAFQGPFLLEKCPIGRAQANVAYVDDRKMLCQTGY
jgi:hypothetical protein